MGDPCKFPFEEGVAASNPSNDDMGWLSLTTDADGPGCHANDVLCMGLVPDDLDEHDTDGGDLSWIGLGPAESHGNVGL